MGVRLPPRAPLFDCGFFSTFRKSFMRRAFATMWIVVLVTACVLPLPTSGQDSPTPRTYLGFDLNTYPGDGALPILRKTFSFTGYWLGPPPGAKENNWLGKRQLLLAQQFGFLLLYNGPLGAELKSAAQAAKRGATDAANVPAVG